jgi:hypothetical protein
MFTKKTYVHPDGIRTQIFCSTGGCDEVHVCTYVFTSRWDSEQRKKFFFTQKLRVSFIGSQIQMYIGSHCTRDDKEFLAGWVQGDQGSGGGELGSMLRFFCRKLAKIVNNSCHNFYLRLAKISPFGQNFNPSLPKVGT